MNPFVCSPGEWFSHLVCDAGMLTDKYIGADGKLLPEESFPPGARFEKYKQWMVRMKQGKAKEAIEKYHAIAKAAGMPLVEMALLWCLSRWSPSPQPHLPLNR